MKKQQEERRRALPEVLTLVLTPVLTPVLTLVLTLVLVPPRWPGPLAGRLG